MSNVLFVCIQNAGRSQMAEALFRRAAGDRHAARSAGSAPAVGVHAEVVTVMAELGIELADRTPRSLSDDHLTWADVVVTMGCGDACPVLPGKRYLGWDLPDPAGQELDVVRGVRDEVGRRVAELLAGLDA